MIKKIFQKYRTLWKKIQIFGHGFFVKLHFGNGQFLLEFTFNVYLQDANSD